MKYMSIVRDLALRSGNWQFYDESFHKLREIDHLGARLIQTYGSGFIKFLNLELRLIFIPNREFLVSPRVTVSNFIQVPNVVAATLCHNAHKLDHGKSQVNLMNPQILPTTVITAKLSHYSEDYDRMLRNKIINRFTQDFKLDFVGERKAHLHLTLCLLRNSLGSLIQRWHQKWHLVVLLTHSTALL